MNLTITNEKFDTTNVYSVAYWNCRSYTVWYDLVSVTQLILNVSVIIFSDSFIILVKCAL